MTAGIMAHIFALACVRAGDAIGSSESSTSWRSWFLSDASVRCIIPLVLAWAQARFRAWRGLGAWEGVIAPIRTTTGAIVARCEVRYSGRLSAVLPEALRLIMVKSDGSVIVHADHGPQAEQRDDAARRGPSGACPRRTRARLSVRRPEVRATSPVSH
jgi:hypothetical protein